MSTLIDIAGLTLAYDTEPVLDRLDLRIAAGQFVVLLGKSGSGKSTLLRALAGLDFDTRSQGTLQVPAERAVLFQDSRLLPWDRVLDNLTLGHTRAERESEARHLLARVGLADRAQAWPNQLSGGEQQRVALARALMARPRLLLADEPFGALDALTRLDMQELLLGVARRQRLTVVLVTHDVDEALRLADRILVLEHGRITHDRTLDDPYPRRPELLAEPRQALLRLLGVDATRGIFDESYAAPEPLRHGAWSS